MVQQRLQNRTLLQLAIPGILILMVAASAIIAGKDQDSQPREAVFDVFMRLHARPAPATDVAIITIDAESLERIGPWPWPRTALAGLVTAAQDAGAIATVVTVPVDGQDPLSPEVAARYWRRSDRSGAVDRVLGQLPTNNAALSAAAVGHPTALGVGISPSSAVGPWTRADALAVSWAAMVTEGATGFVALRTAPLLSRIDPGFDETGMVAISSLPTDSDGLFRRTPLLWSRGEKPSLNAGFAGATLASDGPIILTPSPRTLRAGGAPVSKVQLSGPQYSPIRLDQNGGIRLWLPKDISIPSVPAWRALDGGENWTQPLNGKIVFIGENVTPQSSLATVRGPMTVTEIHAQLASQIRAELLPYRAEWISLTEGGLALLFGALSLLAALVARPLTSALSALLTGLIAFSACLFLFKQTGILFSPVPIIGTVIGAPLAVLGIHIIGMLRGGDVARATFHGALPTSTVTRLQAHGPGKLLDGTRREVTVLSCGVRLPSSVRASFENRPADFIELTGSITDALRRTILSCGGTVDFGEDGRLLGYWNVPETVDTPIEKACGCALKMIEEMNRLADDLQSAAFAGASTGGFADAKLEIGIATGLCFAGAIGLGTRRRYAVIGDTVRLAAALRHRAALYGPAIITDDTVFDSLRHQYAFLDLDVIKTIEDGPTRTVYGLSGNSFLKASRAFRVLADTQREMVLSWRNQDIAATTIQLQKLRGIPGVPDAYVDLYDERLRIANGVANKKTNPAEVLIC